MVSDIGLNNLQNRLLNILLQGWVEPPHVGSLPRLWPRNMTGHPVVDVPEGPDHPGHQDPHLQPV